GGTDAAGISRGQRRLLQGATFQPLARTPSSLQPHPAPRPHASYQMVNRNSQTYYGEVEAAQTLLGYPVANAGCCKVLLHHQWGSAVYPATFFTSAPLDVLLEALKHVN
ncbi:unnamed protein product, partial [Closterium sp. NIES-54]